MRICTMREQINIEYEILSITELPECVADSKFKYSVSISVCTLNKQSKIISFIGNFNIKVKNKKQKHVDKTVVKKIKEIVLFKSENQRSINRKFNKIVKEFNK